MAEFAGMMSGQSPEPTPPAESVATWDCVCGHAASDHQGPMFIFPDLNINSPGCSVCSCSLLRRYALIAYPHNRVAKVPALTDGVEEAK